MITQIERITTVRITSNTSEFEWVDPTYDDILVCGICESEYRVVFARAFLLDGEDYSLVEEYTDSIEQELRRLRNTRTTTQTARKKTLNRLIRS